MKKKYISIIVFLTALYINAQVFQNFEGITGIAFDGSNTCLYRDTDSVTAHDLVNYTNTCGTVVVTSPNVAPNTLGFISSFTPVGGGTGFDDFDAFGVANTAGVISQIASGPIQGSNSFVLEDTDGLAAIKFSQVDLVGTTSPMINLKYHASSTSWESDDLIKITVEITGCGSTTTLTLLDISGTGIDAIENMDNTLSADLTLYVGCKAQLIVEFASNSSSEEMILDDINFTEGSLILPNTAPVSTAFGTPTVAEDAINVALADDVQISDADGDDQTVAFTITGGTLNIGTAGITFPVGTNGTSSFSANGSLANINAALDAATFTPTSNLNGTGAGTIAFISNDGTDDSNTATVTFNITAVNDAPSFTVGANQSIAEDSAMQTVNSFATNLEDGDAEVTQVLSFNVSNNNNALFSTQPAIDASGNLTYTPAAGAFGVATVTVSISDDGGTANAGDIDTSGDQTFTITITPVNDAPSFALPSSPNQTIAESTTNSAETVNSFASMISDGDGDTQMLTFNVTNDNNALFSVQPAINTTTGNLTYTVAANQSGTATVNVILMDNGGTANVGDVDTSASQTFTIQAISIPTITSISLDSGASNTDYVTNDNQPDVSGTAEPGSTIFVVFNGTSSALAGVSAVANAMGNYTISFPVLFGVLLDATANFNVTSTLNGVTTTSAAQQITVDTADPVYSSATTASFVENGTGTAYTATTTDDTAVTYAITGGADQGDLSITTAGVVTFNSAPDFEAAADDNADNDYVIDITATDLAGNTSVQTVTITVTDVDEIAPTVTITSGATDPTGTSPIPVTITFSEEVSGFELGDIAVGNGSPSNLSTTDNIIFTVEITPATDGAVTVDIANNVATDTTGNGNDAASQFSIVYSSTLSITDNSLSSDSFSYANPVSNSLTIESSLEIAIIEVYSMGGSLVASAKGNSLDTSKLASGIYMAIITAENGQNTSIKVVK